MSIHNTSNYAPGPAWIGIGAMRSGTTWLTSLLCQHPKVSLATNDKKEQWLLNRVATGGYEAEDYRALFPDDGLLRGEWSPRYMWLLHTALAADRCIPSSAPILASLRDPIERYASHQRFATMRRASGTHTRWKPDISAGLGTLIGMYADQLAPWEKAVGADRMVVFTYEGAAADPVSTCRRIWLRLGLDSEPVLSDSGKNITTNATGSEWRWPPGLRETLVELFTPQVERLQATWGLDTSPWPNFRHLSGAHNDGPAG